MEKRRAKVNRLAAWLFPSVYDLELSLKLTNIDLKHAKRQVESLERDVEYQQGLANAQLEKSSNLEAQNLELISDKLAVSDLVVSLNKRIEEGLTAAKDAKQEALDAIDELLATINSEIFDEMVKLLPDSCQAEFSTLVGLVREDNDIDFKSIVHLFDVIRRTRDQHLEDYQRQTAAYQRQKELIEMLEDQVKELVDNVNTNIVDRLTDLFPDMNGLKPHKSVLGVYIDEYNEVTINGMEDFFDKIDEGRDAIVTEHQELTAAYQRQMEKIERLEDQAKLDTEANLKIVKERDKLFGDLKESGEALVQAVDQGQDWHRKLLKISEDNRTLTVQKLALADERNSALESEQRLKQEVIDLINENEALKAANNAKEEAQDVR